MCFKFQLQNGSRKTLQKCNLKMLYKSVLVLLQNWNYESNFFNWKNVRFAVERYCTMLFWPNDVKRHKIQSIEDDDDFPVTH